MSPYESSGPGHGKQQDTSKNKGHRKRRPEPTWLRTGHRRQDSEREIEREREKEREALYRVLLLVRWRRKERQIVSGLRENTGHTQTHIGAGLWDPGGPGEPASPVSLCTGQDTALTAAHKGKFPRSEVGPGLPITLGDLATQSLPRAGGLLPAAVLAWGPACCG